MKVLPASRIEQKIPYKQQTNIKILLLYVYICILSARIIIFINTKKYYFYDIFYKFL